MKLPRRIEEILRRKKQLLKNLDDSMNNDVIKLQSKLFESVVSDVVARLVAKNGIIIDNAENYKLLTQLDKTFTSFNLLVYDKILPSISLGVGKLSEINTNYFEMVLTGDLPSRFARVIEKTKSLTELRLGLVDGKMVRGGNIANILESSTNMASIKQMMLRAITSNMNIGEFVKALRTELLGDKAETGKLERQFNRYAYDVYQQYDASYNKKLAEEFDLKYFIYQGGLVEDSRDFCREHDDHVYTNEEAETEWPIWTPSKSVNIDTFKQKDIYAHPGYMDYEGYDPLIDRGGYNCRHIISYISEGLAKKWRPELIEEETVV